MDDFRSATVVGRDTWREKGAVPGGETGFLISRLTSFSFFSFSGGTSDILKERVR